MNPAFQAPLRIAIISKSNAPGGGASRFAEDLAGWLQEQGHECVHFCAKFIGKPRSFQRSFYPGFPGSLCRFIHRLTGWLGLRELFPLEYWLFVRPLIKNFDVLHFHDHFTAYSPLTMAMASKHARVYFTAHDCVHFTGGCLYPMGCQKFAKHCRECPQRQSIGLFDFTYFNQEINKWVYRQFPITYIYPSTWLLNQARRALTQRKVALHIPNGFDPKPYDFQSRTDARLRLELPLDRIVICITAHQLADERKGVIFALKALQAIKALKPLAILIGNPTANFKLHAPDIDFLHAGYMDDRKKWGFFLLHRI